MTDIFENLKHLQRCEAKAYQIRQSAAKCRWCGDVTDGDK